MKAISIHPHWAGFIASSLKSIEVRSRATAYRGPLVICACAKKVRGYETAPRGVAVCLVDLIDCRPMKRADEDDAGCSWQPDVHAYVLANVRPLPAIAVKGQLGNPLWDLPADKAAAIRGFEGAALTTQFAGVI